MVARILRLRLALLGGSLRGAWAQVLARILAKLTIFVSLIVLCWLPTALAGVDTVRLAELDVLLVSTLVLTVAFAGFFRPTLVLDPRQFAQFPASSWTIGIALLVTAPLTWVGIGCAVWAVAFVYFRDLTWSATTVLAVLGLAVMTLAGARLLASITARFLDTRIARAMQRTLGILVAVSFIPLALYFGITMSPEESSATTSDIAAAVMWSPPGALVAHLHNTGPALAPGWVVASILLTIILLLLVGSALSTSVSKPQPGSIMRSPTGWFDMLPLNPTMAIAARCLTYWVRDPRYWVSLVAIPVIPVLVLAVMLVVGLSTKTLVVILLPLTFVLFGWMIHNDVASDSSAFWIHVASGIRGWQDRLGRAFPVFVFGVPVLLISASVAVMILDDWRVLPGILGLGFVALSAGVSVSSIMSVSAPYPTTRPHESPFVQPLWYRSGAGISQTLSMLGSTALTLPVFLVVERLIREPELPEQFATMGFSVAYGIVLLAIGVAVGGLIFNRRSSKILAFTQVFD